MAFVLFMYNNILIIENICTSTSKKESNKENDNRNDWLCIVIEGRGKRSKVHS